MAFDIDNWGVINDGRTLRGVGLIMDPGEGGGSIWLQAVPQNGGTRLFVNNLFCNLGDDGLFAYGFDLTCSGRGGAFGLHGGGQT
jgi:hypothetical protein